MSNALSEPELHKIQEKLLDERRRAYRKLGFLEASIMKSQDPTAKNGFYYSQHPAEIGTDANEREKNYRIATSESRYLYRVNEALERIETGDFGQCRTCSDLIPFERLLLVPTARVCVCCKEEEERLRFQGR